MPWAPLSCPLPGASLGCSAGFLRCLPRAHFPHLFAALFGHNAPARYYARPFATEPLLPGGTPHRLHPTTTNPPMTLRSKQSTRKVPLTDDAETTQIQPNPHQNRHLISVVLVSRRLSDLAFSLGGFHQNLIRTAILFLWSWSLGG